MNVALSATSELAVADPLPAPVVIVGAGLAGLPVALRFADRHPVVELAKRAFYSATTARVQGGIVSSPAVR